jgi:hypothetical protein
VTVVGERALARYERPDGRYDVFASQWAGNSHVLASALGNCAAGLGALERADWERNGCASREEVVERLDYLSITVIYEFSGDGIRVRLPVWLGLDSLARDDGPLPPGFGALIPVGSVAEALRVRLGTRWLREAAARAVEVGLVSVPAAVTLLVVFLLPPPRNQSPLVSRFLDEGSLPDAGGTAGHWHYR